MNSQPDAPPGDISAASSHPAARRWSVRTFLVWLVLACLLPGIIGATALFTQMYRYGRAQLEKDRLLTARALVQAVDNQILRVEALAHGLATAPPLAHGDLAGFHRQARETLKRANLVASVVLIDRSGWQVLNTLKEFGEPLPLNGNPELMRRVFETGTPVVSDIYLGAVMRRPIMTVAVPVVIDGSVAYVLIAPTKPEKFSAILEAQGLPAGWLASIVDSTGTLMARTGAGEELVGRKAAPEFLRYYTASREGTLETIAADGTALFSAFSRSPLTHWGVVIDIPQATLEADLTHVLSMLALGVLGLFATGLALAWFMGKKIGRSIQSLVAPASALGSGRPLVIPTVEVQEAAELAKALDEAARLLQERTAALQAREAELAARTAALRQSEIRLRTLTQHAPGAIAVFDREMRYLAASRRWLEEYRLSAEGIEGRSHYQLFPNLPEKWKEAHRRGLAGEVIRAEADRYERSDGSQHWLRWEVWPWRDDSGAIGGIVIASEDITGRTEAEMALRHSEERLLRALDAARMMSFEYDRASGRIHRRGSTVKALGIGFDDEEKSFLARIHPEDRPLFLRTLTGLTPENPDYSLQYRFCLPDGTYRWLVDHSRALFDESGRLAGVQGVFMDYEAQKKAELQLAVHAQRQTLLLEAASGILENWGEKADMARIIFDTVSRHLDADVCFNYRVNPDTGGLELLTGIGISEEVRQAIASLHSGSGFCGTVAAAGALLVADQKRIGEDDLGEFPRAIGLRAYVGCPLYSPEGGIAGTFALASTRRDHFSQDEVDFIQTIAYFLSLAWERWRIEKQVQELNSELERRVEERTAALVKSNLELQRFAYIAAHDLQTPLRSIASFTQLLGIQLKDRLDPESGEYMQRVSENTRRMQNLINDLLAYSRLDAQARPFKETDMRRLFEEVKGSLAGSLRETGAAVTGGELPTLFVDRTQIAQVFTNLIENGIKYNQSKQIEVRISARREGDEWIFAVADNGIGIEPRHQAQIFAAFKRLHAYHQYPGSGVGLAICQRVIERHGGRIWVESVPGSGSTFYFALPAMRREAAGEPKPRPPA